MVKLLKGTVRESGFWFIDQLWPNRLQSWTEFGVWQVLRLWWPCKYWRLDNMEDWPSIYIWFPEKYLICNKNFNENCIWMISFCHMLLANLSSTAHPTCKDEYLKAIMPLQQKYTLLYLYGFEACKRFKTNDIVLRYWTAISYIFLAFIF